MRWIPGSAASVGVATLRPTGCAGRGEMQSPEICGAAHPLRSAAAGFFSRIATAFSRAFTFCACRSAIAAISGVMAPVAREPLDVELERVEAVCCRLPELLLDDVVVPLSDCVEDVLEDVLVDDDDDSGAVLDEVLLLELVELEVSLGAVPAVVVLELVVDVVVLDGADAITIGELDAAALRSVEKATVVGAVVVLVLVVPLLVV